ncbi:MAG: DNA repair protein RecN [Clostridia bacterium]|nr:DNA repair protein RecN [Clostridia bacterium]
MLASLIINNVALIEKLEINFGSNLNVITGETGSGKSIMLNALGFVIGDRLDKKLLRTGAEVMRVDAIFSNLSSGVYEKISNILEQNIEDEIIISREFNINGKTFCKVNNQIVTSSILKQITSLLIDIHCQHQHQALLNRDYQLSILDNFCGENIKFKIDQLNRRIDEIFEIEKQLKQLGGTQKEKQNLIDLYCYQLKEIDDAKIYENELEELEEQFKELKNSEKISNILNENLNLTNSSNFNATAIEQIAQAKKNISNISDVAEKYNKIYERLTSLEIELNDINLEMAEINGNLAFDENKFNEIDQRIDFIKAMFRKYGGDFEKLVEYKNDISQKLDNLINGEKKYNELTVELEKILKVVNTLQEEISNIRKENAEILKNKLEKQLKLLGMKDARFDINFDKITEPYSRTGFDYIDFMFSANIGFELKPLSAVASGGELSRFMLAYKIVVNNIDEIDCLIFDEIDTGISGNIANVVADCMGEYSRNKQLIVVSHLPQICAMADVNFLVEKYSNETTHTKMEEIEKDNLIKEIARLMGLVDSEGFEFAKKLKEKANEFKKKLI